MPDTTIKAHYNDRLEVVSYGGEEIYLDMYLSDGVEGYVSLSPKRAKQLAKALKKFAKEIER